MANGDICVRMVPFPGAVRAVTLPNNDGTWDIYINKNLPEEWQRKALEHELNHIRMGHFYDDNPVAQNEKEAG